MERLQRDIPKFLNNSRVIKIEHKEWWNNLFEQADVIYGMAKEKPATWLLDELRFLKFRHGAHTNTPNWINDHQPQPVVPNTIPGEVIELVNSQLTDIPEVNVKYM